MKIALLYAAMPGYDFKLQKVINIIEETLSELPVELNVISLAYEQLPFCDGIKSQGVERIIAQLNAADGIVLACSATLCAPSGLMQNMLDHLYKREQDMLFTGKCCMYAVCSPDASEGFAIEALQRAVARLHGYDCGKLAIGAGYLEAIDSDPAFQEIIEKQAEDFFRAVSQKRRAFIPSSAQAEKPMSAPVVPKSANEPKPESSIIEAILENEAEDAVFEPFINENTKKIKTRELYKKTNGTELDSEDERQISEIAGMLEKKFLAEAETAQARVIEKPVKKGMSCYEQSSQMTDRFSPKDAIGLKAIFQLIISGDESFEAYIKIHNKECEFIDGVTDNADIIIIADSKAWLEILSGKLNCQTAFRVGRFKVRGNFVLLGRFDQIFGLS